MKTGTDNDLILDSPQAREIWHEWTRLWNGEYELAQQIVGDPFDLVLTAAVSDDPAEITDEKKVAAWIRTVRDKFATIEYSTVAGPYVDTEKQVIACGWEARGVFAGKTSLPEDQSGKSFHIAGTDILTLRNGKISACRTMSNPARPVR